MALNICLTKITVDLKYKENRLLILEALAAILTIE